MPSRLIRPPESALPSRILPEEPRRGAESLDDALALRHLEDFVELISDNGREYDLAEVHVTGRASCVGGTIADSNRRDRGLIVVGIRRPDGEVLMPSPAEAISSGDCLIALGPSAVTEEPIRES